MSHDWHTFDVERGYEVRGVGEEFEVRKVGEEGPGTMLSKEEFDEFRREGPNPKGLD